MITIKEEEKTPSKVKPVENISKDPQFSNLLSCKV